MIRPIQTAVAASALPATRQWLPGMLADAGIELTALARDGCTAWQLLENHRPDLLVADLELPAMDGAQLAHRALLGFALPVRPAVALLCRGEVPPADRDALEACGAALLNDHPRPEDFRTAIDKMRSLPPRFSPQMCDRASRLLDSLGVPRHAGRDCLQAAILLCAGDVRAIHNLRSRVYPVAGEICKLTPRQAERAMRHAIDLAWRSDRVDDQYRIFADTIDAGRGQPTCGEMISRLADILRLEG